MFQFHFLLHDPELVLSSIVVLEENIYLLLLLMVLFVD